MTTPGVENAAQPSTRMLSVHVFAPPLAPACDALELHLAAITAQRGAAFRTVSSLPAGTRWESPSPTAAAWVAPTPDDRRQGDPDRPPRVAAADALVGPGFLTRVVFRSPHLPTLALLANADGTELVIECAAQDAAGPRRLFVRGVLPAGVASLLFVPVENAPFAGYSVVMHDRGVASDDEIAALQQDATAPAPTPALDVHERQWTLATRAIGEWNRRTALFAIAFQTTSAPAADVILSADLQRLVAITTEVERTSARAADYPWQFERAVLLALVPGLQRDNLSPALYACAVRQLGAVAFDPAGLRIALRAAKSAHEFTAQLQRQNVEDLDDRDPAARLAAHRWLEGHGETVPGYDPLGEPAARRAALQQHAAATAAKGDSK